MTSSLEVRPPWTQNENVEGGQWKMTWFERNFGPVRVEEASPVRAAHLAHNSFGRWSLQTWRAMNNAEYNKSSNWLFLATCILGYFFKKCFRFSYYRHSPLFSKSLKTMEANDDIFIFQRKSILFLSFHVQVSIYLCAAMEFKTKHKLLIAHAKKNCWEMITDSSHAQVDVFRVKSRTFHRSAAMYSSSFCWPR